MARFKEKVQIQPGSVSTGAAQGMMSLADRLEGFKSIGANLVKHGAEQARGEAQQRGIASAGQVPIDRVDGVSQAPAQKEVKFFGGIEATAHNKALRSSYLASVGNDIRTNVARIETENPDNLVSFNENVNSWANGIIKGVDPSIRNEVMQAVDNRVTTSRIQVQNAAVEKQNKEAAFNLESGAKTALDEALNFASNGDLRSSAMGLIEYNTIVDSQVEAGFILPAAAVELKRDAELKATHENLVGNIRRIANGGKTLDAVELIINAQQKIPKGMSVDEHQDLTSSMVAELNEGLNIKSKLDVKSGEKNKVEQSTNYSALAIGIAQGTTDSNSIIRNLRDGEITEQQFDKLLNTMNRRGQGVDSFQLINLINGEIRQGGDLESTRNTIIANTGTNLTEATSQGLLTTLNEYLDKESILNTSNVKRARDFITPSIRVTGPLGALDTEAEQRLASSIRGFDKRVLAGEDPWAVADELVGKDALEREPSPMFGTKADLKTSLDDLNTAFDGGQIDEATYNFEFERIEKLKWLITNIEAFNNSKKEADANAKQ